jgi:O-antigen ligase/polysaccharide polymerase Wzy-like membrane protein
MLPACAPYLIRLSFYSYQFNMARPVSTDGVQTSTMRTLRVDVVLSGLIAAVFFARCYLPTEATPQGETLWIVGLWLLIGIVASVAAWRSGRALRRLDGLDGSVLLLIGGQLVSAIVVVATTGDKRAAVNVAWEWFGVGIVWFLLRPRLVTASFREAFLQASIVTGLVLAGLGLWQHYVSQPRLAAEYGPLFDRLRVASGPEAEAIQRKLVAAGIPTDGPGLMLFEKRLRDSREPLGFFGLANTFGGCLAVWLVLAVAELSTEWRRGCARWGRLAVPFIVVGLIAWCLLLTKSRTAVMGAGCGMAMLFAGRRSPSLRLRRVIVFIGPGVGLLIAGVGLLFQFGGLDREVLSEAPKSLAYRLQYWQATSRLVADHVWFGVGPGNFRPHYLRYKLPEASEEIADPHNLFFDVAATGGAISLIGLALLIGLTLIAHGGSKRLALADADGECAAPARRPPQVEAAHSAFWFAGLAPLLAFSGQLCWSGEWDDRPLILMVLWFAVAVAWRQVVSRDAVKVRAQAHMGWAAFVALAVHLLGAGGIAMPAVSQLLVALIALSLAPPDDSAAMPQPPASRRFAVIATALALAAIVFAWSALIPVTNGQRWLSLGNQLVMSADGRARAEGAYRAACRADDWSPEPWRHRAELAFERASAERFRSNESFETAVELLRAAIARDPVNFQGPRMLGNWWIARWRVTRSGDDAREAAQWLGRASDSYPTNALILAELTIALDADGQRGAAIATAKRAMAQDELNRKLGHVDRYLDDELVTRLRSVTEVPIR